jgi:hypothetical protein
MQKRNFSQARKQREAARKARQQEKLERKHSRGDRPAAPDAPLPDGEGADNKATS